MSGYICRSIHLHFSLFRYSLNIILFYHIKCRCNTLKFKGLQLYKIGKKLCKIWLFQITTYFEQVIMNKALELQGFRKPPNRIHFIAHAFLPWRFWNYALLSHDSAFNLLLSKLFRVVGVWVWQLGAFPGAFFCSVADNLIIRLHCWEELSAFFTQICSVSINTCVFLYKTPDI